ncbi:MAG: hypothetical protein JNM27_19610 [Leptospirales bacterium]|nr:hypothetical protein [Leptospirales bacterium]
MSDLEKPEKGSNLLQSMGEGLTNIADSLTGRHLENRIREYTELYADVLLGLHRDLRNLEARTESLPDKKQFESMMASMQRTRTLLIVSICVSLASVGGFVWILLR